MAFSIYSINDVIDSRLIVIKAMPNQAKVGTLVHILDSKNTEGGINVVYRVTGSGQDYSVEFSNVKEFCKWAKPDTFISRYYESFSNQEIQRYLKVSGRSITSFCLPIIAVSLVVIWALAMLVLSGVPAITTAAVLSIAAMTGVFYFYKSQKSKVKVSLYGKISKDNNWGVKLR